MYIQITKEEADGLAAGSSINVTVGKRIKATIGTMTEKELKVIEIKEKAEAKLKADLAKLEA